jgi:isoquinoline 1-oxidoreductase alpha subunit
MEIMVNGVSQTVDPAYENGVLLWVIRDQLGLTGTRFGCGAGICGACTVHVDGVATRSCVTPVAEVAGKEIRTIEALAENGVLHPVQQAFIDHQVPQCAWCMSGQMMQAASLLAQNNAPSEEEIVAGMSKNYCRCGCYVRIKAAVAKAAEMMQEAG